MNLPPKGAAIPVKTANSVTTYPPLPLLILSTFSENCGKNTVLISPHPTIKLKNKVNAVCLFVKKFKFKTGSSALFSIDINNGIKAINIIK